MSLKPDFLSVVRHSVTLKSHIRLLRLKTCFRVAVPSVVQLIFFLTEVFLIIGAMASC